MICCLIWKKRFNFFFRVLTWIQFYQEMIYRKIEKFYRKLAKEQDSAKEIFCKQWLSMDVQVIKRFFKLFNLYAEVIIYPLLIQWRSLHEKGIQSITKKHIPPVLQHFVYSVYHLNRLSYKKSVIIFLHPFLKSFQLK